MNSEESAKVQKCPQFPTDFLWKQRSPELPCNETGEDKLGLACSPYILLPVLNLCLSQSVQSPSRDQLFSTPWTAARQVSLSVTNFRSLLKLMPSSQWCHSTISSSVVPFSSCLQSFPASGSFPMSQFFTSGGQSIGISASASVLPVNIQDWFPLGLTGWISLKFKGLSKSLLQHHSSKALILQRSAFFIVQLLHPYVTTGKKSLAQWKGFTTNWPQRPDFFFPVSLGLGIGLRRSCFLMLLTQHTSAHCFSLKDAFP